MTIIGYVCAHGLSETHLAAYANLYTNNSHSINKAHSRRKNEHFFSNCRPEVGSLKYFGKSCHMFLNRGAFKWRKKAYITAVEREGAIDFALFVQNSAGELHITC